MIVMKKPAACARKSYKKPAGASRVSIWRQSKSRRESQLKTRARRAAKLLKSFSPKTKSYRLKDIAEVAYEAEKKATAAIGRAEKKATDAIVRATDARAIASSSQADAATALRDARAAKETADKALVLASHNTARIDCIDCQDGYQTPNVNVNTHAAPPGRKDSP